jgi:hypothetical protein
MQQLVEGVDKVRFSHEGVLFLLRDMGIHAPTQQDWGEGEGATLGMYHSPPLSPPRKSSKMAPPPTEDNENNNMVPVSVGPPSSMNPLLLLQPLRPNTPSIAAWPPPRAPTPRTHQQQQNQQHRQQSQQQQRQKQLAILRDNVLSFDFSASVLPGLTFPEDFRAYHCPRDEIIMTETYVPPPPNPLRKGSHDPVFFSSPTLKANIDELFGCTVQRKDNGQQHGHSTWQAPPALPYDPEDDDLVAWKKRSEGQIDDEYNEVKVGFDTWPAWNPRFDLEM